MSIYGRAQNSWDRSAACTSQKVHCTTFGKERVHPKELFKSVIPMSVALLLRNLRTELRKKPCNKNDAPAEMPRK